jgi:hypothetical protein
VCCFELEVWEVKGFCARKQVERILVIFYWVKLIDKRVFYKRWKLMGFLFGQWFFKLVFGIHAFPP